MTPGNDNTNNSQNHQLKLPPKTELPFFAYGFFKHDELAYNKIKDCVKNEPAKRSVRGILYEKDGLPIFTRQRKKASEKYYDILGELITFKDGRKAYERIAYFEPWELYDWDTIDISNSEKANILVAKDSLLSEEKTVNGAVMMSLKDMDPKDYGGLAWHGYNDYLFAKGMKYLQENFFDKADEFWINASRIHDDKDFKKLFSLQTAYTFLWTIIDRHNSIKYYLKSKSKALSWQREQMAGDKLFKTAVEKIGNDFIFTYPTVYESSSDRAVSYNGSNYSPSEWKAKLDAYYIIRCNVVHRGKEGHDSTDFPKIRGAFLDMFAIIQYMLRKELKDINGQPYSEEDALYAIEKLKRYKRKEEFRLAQHKL